MSKDTFPFSSNSLRSLRLEQEFQEWENARQALAHRRAMTRAPLPRAPRPPPRQQRLQEVRAPPPQARCRDTAIHNTFMCGDMKGVYAVLKDPAMVNALMETVHEEMVWTPEMGMWTLSSKVKQTSALRLAASRGHSGCVEELLFRGAEVNADPGGYTALHDACMGGHSVCVQLLLSHGADPELLAADGSAPLHLCTSPLSFHCAELLLEGGAEVNVRTRESRLTPLHVAARRGLEEHVELFLSHGADVLATNREGETPLNAACSGAERHSEAGRYLRVVQRLLDAGADPRTAGRKQHTPLHNACANCCPRIVDVLLQHGAKADVANCAGYTPMDCLLQVVEDFPDQRPEAIARSLLNHGAQPVSPKMLKQCILSPATLEVMLNSYASIPPCDWMDSLPADVSEEQRSLLLSVRQRSGQPRSLQHLCRRAVRLHLGARCHSAISSLDIPCSVRGYLLLCNDGTLL
ncbi:ankyrin repeat and SOCS box protein 16 [Mugil cephalus]|uniref:ankyrin repeat and SOCS box protein 16 n=1 Tax=Mugil cephalus TaxID=48193 RepID=UPI001FB7BD81|nr:ankyrin repeat and SOCS box protein 16 [Mugil cephalus]XP_047426958.1 ankyrin repeat and SOCS box protein 16 [Mugil cephalus]XP_047426959.1 ankyrin repeat and SOCS box protein 16 [Mugil cephalus]XP_047426960.1 ankyrin repeat and SOCS box protein 16 [Mugil cephalus]XP_047426962.1 ankyrin repeat and SOCS box protein 16 [Mugil cephalus]XP_047426963.1 ankyrin repeat and SOCS box protein 16 [Mugil cephalus]